MRRRFRLDDTASSVENVREPRYRAVAHLLVPQTFEEWAPTVDVPNDELAANVRAECDSRLDDASSDDVILC